MNTTYTFKEVPTDLLTTAKQLDQFMKDLDFYGYLAADGSEQQALYDLENDPYFVVTELIRIARDLMEV